VRQHWLNALVATVNSLTVCRNRTFRDGHHTDEASDKTLPALVPMTSAEEAAALEYARGFVKACKEEEFIDGFGYAALHPAAG
jgi:hypothetical protein